MRELLVRNLAKIILLCLAGALNSAPALAYRVGFSVQLADGTPLSHDAEICFHRAAGVKTPFEQFFVSNDVHCFPGDKVIELPTGFWNFYARGARSVSANPGVLSFHGTHDDQRAYKNILLTVQPAVAVSFRSWTDVISSFGPDAYAAVYVTGSADRLSNVYPVPEGQTELLVPVGIRAVPLIIRNGRPIVVGEPFVGAAHEKRVALPQPDRETNFIVAEVQVDPVLTTATDRRFIDPPSLRFHVGNRMSFGFDSADVSRLSLLFIPADVVGRIQGVLSVVGECWERDELFLDLDTPTEGNVAIADRPIAIVPAGSVEFGMRRKVAEPFDYSLFRNVNGKKVVERSGTCSLPCLVRAIPVGVYEASWKFAGLVWTGDIAIRAAERTVVRIDELSTK